MTFIILYLLAFLWLLAALTVWKANGEYDIECLFLCLIFWPVGSILYLLDDLT